MKIFDGDLTITAKNRGQFQDLEEVTGYLDVSADFQDKWATFSPKKVTWPLVTVDGKYILADGILQELVSKRGPVYRTRAIFTGKMGYLVTDGEGSFSHGDTIKEALDSLVYKIGNRDKSKFRGMTRKTVMTFTEAVEAYRVITGACAAGTRAFVESKVGAPKEAYTVAEIVELTKGQYGSAVFAAFFS